MLASVGRWLETDGLGKLWDETSFDVSGVARKIEHDEVVILAADGTIAASLYLENRDAEFWPDDAPGEALYIHKLVVDRAFAGRWFFRLILDWAAGHAASSGHRFLRLDCAPREKLVNVYTEAGFQRVGKDMVIGGYLVARLQRDLSLG